MKVLAIRILAGALLASTLIPMPAQAQTTTRVITLTNITPPVAPPTFLAPNTTGLAVPAASTGLKMLFDTSKVPNGATFNLSIDLLKNGAVVWNTGDDMYVGPTWTDDNGVQQTIRELDVNWGSFPPSLDPDHARLKVKSWGGWQIPTLTVDFFS